VGVSPLPVAMSSSEFSPSRSEMTLMGLLSRRWRPPNLVAAEGGVRERGDLYTFEAPCVYACVCAGDEGCVCVGEG